MKKEYPLAKILEYKNNQYLFDAKSNTVLSIQKNQYEHLNKLMNNASCDAKVSDNIPLKELRKKGILLPGPLRKKVLTNNFTINQKFKKYSKTLFYEKINIEVTQDCNLRCKYCHFTKAEKIDYNSRKHTEKHMIVETAYKIIDFYYERAAILSKRRKDFISYIKKIEPLIQFYGGEPLLNFKVLKQTIEYAKNKNWEKIGLSKDDFFYGITTNLTILTDEILDFIVKNNIYLHVSIDGPRSIHNSNRIFRDGSGSFDIVMRNLKKIKSYNEKYFLKCIVFQSVEVDFESEFEMQSIFNELELTDKTPIVHYLNQSEKGKCVANVETKLKEIEDGESIIKKFEDKLKSWQTELKQKDDFIKIKHQKHDHFFSILTELLRIYKTLNNYTHINNYNYHNRAKLCPIGFGEIYIDTDGFVHMCEKTDGNIPIGDINSGLDLKKIKQASKDFLKIMDSDNCRECVNFYFCDICPAKLTINGSFFYPAKQECNYYQKKLVIEIVQYILLTTNYSSIVNEIEKCVKI